MLGDYRTLVASRDGLKKADTDRRRCVGRCLAHTHVEAASLDQFRSRGMRVQAFRLRDMAGPQSVYTRLDIEGSSGMGEILSRTRCPKAMECSTPTRGHR